MGGETFVAPPKKQNPVEDFGTKVISDPISKTETAKKGWGNVTKKPKLEVENKNGGVTMSFSSEGKNCSYSLEKNGDLEFTKGDGIKISRETDKNGETHYYEIKNGNKTEISEKRFKSELNNFEDILRKKDLYDQFQKTIENYLKGMNMGKQQISDWVEQYQKDFAVAMIGLSNWLNRQGNDIQNVAQKKDQEIVENAKSEA